MHPTLNNGDHVFIKKSAYGIRLPRNMYEIPWLGNVAYYITPDDYIDSIISTDKSFYYINVSIPDKGDIIALNVPGNNHMKAIKRCVGLSGDSLINICDTTCLSERAKTFPVIPFKGMKVPKSQLSEFQSYLLNKNRDFYYNEHDSSFIALDNFIFVLSDNMPGAEDSRTWGAIPNNLIIGKLITY